jgi:lysyl oxidase
MAPHLPRTLLAIVLTGAAVALLPIAVPEAQAQAQLPCGTVVPCSDHGECPDLTADTTFMDPTLSPEVWTSDQCAVIEGEVEAGYRLLLRFTTVTPNLGPGDLIIGKPSNFPELFENDTCHGHQHLKGYAAYRLWTARGYQDWLALRQANPGVCSPDLLAANPKIAKEMVGGRKQGFCLADVLPSEFGSCQGAPKRKNGRYTSCFTNMGISACWADGYGSFLDGQWIDVTGLQKGDYMLEHEANPNRTIEETDYLNNANAIPVTLP